MDVKQRMQRLWLPHAMLYSAGLHVTVNEQAHFFSTATEEADWLDVNEPTLQM